MSEHPTLGMYYETGRKKLKGRLGKDIQIRESILNQVQLHEGEKAKLEIERELSMIEKGSHSFSGAGSVQTGIGNGYKLGEGRWRRTEKGWQRIV